MGSVLSVCTCYNFLNEFTPNNSKITVSTLYLSFQIVPAIRLPLFLGVIDEDVFPFLWLGLILSALGLCLTVSSIPESPHYLYSRRRFLECQASLNYIARFNRVSEGGPNFVDMTEMHRGNLLLSSQVDNDSSEGGSIMDLAWFFSQIRVEKSHLKHFLIISACWTCSSMSYYMLTFRLSNLAGGNMLFNGFTVGVAELLANLIVGTFLAELGLKTTLIGSYLLAALASILYLFPILTLAPWYAAILFFLRLGLVSGFAGTFYGTNALFRPDLIPLVFAIANIWARLATAVTPQIGRNGDTVTMAVVFSLSLLGMMAANFISGEVLMKKKKKKRSSKEKKKKHRSSKR